jgi:hypothetical protein
MVSDERFADTIDEEEVYQDLGLNDDQEEQRVVAETVARAKQRAAESTSRMNFQLRTDHSLHDFEHFVATFDPSASRIYELKVQVGHLNSVLSLPYHCCRQNQRFSWRIG